MIKYCPNCGTQVDNGEEQVWDKGMYDEGLPDVEVKNVILLCTNCKYGWNCVGTKKV